MSAWICSDKHIFELAQYFVDNCQQYVQPVNKISFKEAAEMLYNENCQSVEYRYHDDPTEREPLNAPIAYVATIKDPAVLAKQAHCYSYQACEHPMWETSKAHEMIEEILDSILRNLPGYEDAPWGID